MKRCPTCKRPFGPDIDVGGIKRQRLFDYVARHPEGVTRDQIMTAVYKGDATGGPEDPKIVGVVVRQINQRLRKMGHSHRIRGAGGPGSTYRLLEAAS